MSNKIKVAVLALMIFGTISFMYIGLKSQSPSMVNFLEHEGYPNAKVESVNPFTYTVTFKSDSGYVSVRSYKRVMQIVY